MDLFELYKNQDKMKNSELFKKFKKLFISYFEDGEDYNKDVDGGLYVGPAGIAYAFYYLSIARGLTITEDEKQQQISRKERNGRGEGLPKVPPSFPQDPYQSLQAPPNSW